MLWQYTVFSLLRVSDLFLTAVVRFIFTIFWCMTWIPTACTHWRKKKKNRSAYCATIWHWEWSASCRVRDVCRTICKDCTEYACAVCALVFLCLNVSHLVLMSILEIEVLMSRSWPLGMIWKKIKKEKKTWKVKQESQDLWEQKNVWLQG